MGGGALDGGVGAFFSCVIALTAIPAFAQEPTPTPPAPQPEQTPAAPQTPLGPPLGGLGAPPVIRPYDRVITKEAQSDEGLFTVHRIGDRLYYEIPTAQLGKEFLWVSQIARTTVGAGQGGQALGSRVVKWERRGNRVALHVNTHGT